MQAHFAHLGPRARDRLFGQWPQELDHNGPAADVGAAFGATLYMPATRRHLARDLTKAARRGVVSSVVCLEDSISDHDVEGAQLHAVEQLRALAASGAARPLVFVRVRTPEQIGEIVTALAGSVSVLAGFVLPKFIGSRATTYLEAVAAGAEKAGHRLLAMPVLESPELMHRETRLGALLDLADELHTHREIVACVRIGATDLSAALGLRRPRELTVYDIGPVADVISDIVNVLGRADGTGHVIAGPVWEYFAQRPRLFKPQLRTTPFEAHDAVELRSDLLTDDLDGLIREVVLDRARGILGKSVIHPSHVPVVHALSVVSAEEFADAQDITTMHAAGGGVRSSEFSNKMNEAGPHQGWALATLRRARTFGVAAPDISLVDFLEEERAGESP